MLLYASLPRTVKYENGVVYHILRVNPNIPDICGYLWGGN